MTILLTILHVIVCLLLIAVILLQVGKGHGLTGGGFGDSNAASSIFGTKTGDFLSKVTTIAAIVFILTTISLDVILTITRLTTLDVPGVSRMSQVPSRRFRTMLLHRQEEDGLHVEVVDDVQNFVEHVCRIAGGRGNHFRSILIVLVRSPRVKCKSSPISKVSRECHSISDFACDREALTITPLIIVLYPSSTWLVISGDS